MAGKDDFDSVRLESYLRGHLPHFRGPLAIAKIEGGQSNPTYILDTPNTRYVLRKKPAGKLLPSAHAVEREYRVMHALREVGFPVPRMHLLCEDQNVIGTPFYLMAFVEGRHFIAQSLPSVAHWERGPLYDAMNDTIARLHSVDFAALGLGDYGKPSNYLVRQIERWTKQYRASETETVTAMDRLIDWLPAHLPPGEEVALVHGDFRLDNLLFHPTEPRVIAVLDWELSTLGDPLADFAYHCMSWYIPPGLFRGIAGLDLMALGIPDETQYVARYCERTGRDRIEHWDFYLAYNLFRFAAILQGIAGRVRDGTATAPDAAVTGSAARPIADLGWQIVERRLESSVKR